MEDKGATVEEKVAVEEVPEETAAGKQVDGPLVAETEAAPEAPKKGGWGIQR